MIRNIIIIIRRWLKLDWVDIAPTDPLTADTHGEHKVEFVSRHAIAETGLICPVCGTEVAPLGSYIMVQRSRLGEVIVCNGKRQIQDTEITCGMMLVASPDTEHGDDILWDRVPKGERHTLFHSFVRISKGDAAKLKYGLDVVIREGQLAVPVNAPTTTDKPTSPVLYFEPQQVWWTTLDKAIEITRVQVDNDPVYHGWAWGRFQNGDDWEWHIDRYGNIKQSMRDPTQNDHGKLTHKV